MKRRRTFLMVSLFSAIYLSSPGSALAQEKPNIIMVFMDNFGYGELGIYGGGITRGAPTPRIDRLAHEGIRLTNFNVEVQCTPSRAALMTGRYAVRSGNGSVPITTGMYGLTQWEITMAEMLSDVGYATGMFGKWHLGHTKGRFPTDQGFDEWYGIPNSTDESLWPGQPQFNAVVKEKLSPYAVLEYVYDGKRGSTPKKVKIYDSAARLEIDRECTDRAKDFITRQTEADKPFFVFLPYTQTHMPVVPSKEFAGKSGNGDWATCSCKSMPTLANYSTLSMNSTLRITPYSSSPRITVRKCFQATTGGAAPGVGAISPALKARYGCRLSCAGPTRSLRVKSLTR